MMDKFVWRPSDEYVENSNIYKFIRDIGLKSFEELHRRSVEDIEWFSETMIKRLGIFFRKPYKEVLDLKRGVEWPIWFSEGELNIVETCLDKKVESGFSNNIALIYEGEGGELRKYTYYELLLEVNRFANLLKKLGIQRGDRVGLFMPMIPEVVISFLAIIRTGAILIPLFSGFGPEAVSSRLRDAEAKILITVDGFLRRGKIVPTMEIVDEALRKVPSVEWVIVKRRTGIKFNIDTERDIIWEDAIEKMEVDFEPEILESNDPFMIIYTSGTTGKPKGALHTHTGFPVKSAIDMYLGLDLKSSDTLFWVTDMGWMMGPWEVLGSLILGATMFIYDGALDFPGPERLFEMIDRHRITVLGVSPTLVRSLMRYGDKILKRASLSSLRILGSTGEPWNPEPWLWFFEKVGKTRCPIINYSGGTEVSGGILMGNVLVPLKPCAFSGPVPGMDADVFDENGKPVRGEVGELVVKKPWVGMTKGFWRDPERYIETYWSRWKGIWVHGDFAKIDEDNLWYILGRSDDTIKVAGKRIGPAEIESILVDHPAVVEAACIGIPDPLKGEEVVAFVVLKPEFAGGPALESELIDHVARNAGKALKPKEVKFVRDLPKTRNAKVMRRVIKRVYLGEDPGDLSALENPDSIEEIKKLRGG
jgi:acetyl-CoA synthetase